jgi:hypothetical protein
VIARMRCRTRNALGELTVLPLTRSTPLDSIAQTADSGRLCWSSRTVCHHPDVNEMPKYDFTYRKRHRMLKRDATRSRWDSISMLSYAWCGSRRWYKRHSCKQARCAPPRVGPSIKRAFHHPSKDGLLTAPSGVYMQCPAHRSTRTPVLQGAHRESASLPSC